MARMRALSAQARPAPAVPAAQTLEATDGRLGAVLATALTSPSPAVYRSGGRGVPPPQRVRPRALVLSRAIALDHTDAANYDALARLWRDSGFPQLGLVDAYRAVYYAPHSAVARNTLGTILQALGNRALAHDEYVRALEIDPSAAYALNNLCYGYTLEGETSKAIAACEQALKLSRTSRRPATTSASPTRRRATRRRRSGRSPRPATAPPRCTTPASCTWRSAISAAPSRRFRRPMRFVPR